MSANELITQNYAKINETILSLNSMDSDLKRKYTTFLRNLKEIVYFDFGNIVFYCRNGNSWELEAFYQIEWDPVIEENYVEHEYKEDDVFPIFATKIPIMVRSTEVFPDSRKRDEYYKRFMEPAGFEYSLECNIVFPEDVNCYGICSLFRDPSKNDFSFDDKRPFEIFQPHLSAVSTRYFPRNAVIGRSYGFDAAGLIYIGADYSVLYEQDEYSAITNRYDHEPGGITSVIIQELKKYTKGAEVPWAGAVWWDYKFPSYPLYAEIIRNIMPANITSAYICRLYDLSIIITRSIYHLSGRYSLTPRESEIIRLLVEGENAENVAKKLYISIATVKKHLTSIYAKLGIDGQHHILSILGLVSHSGDKV